jgi:hypothetical protein
MRSWGTGEWRRLIGGIALYGIRRLVLQWTLGFDPLAVFQVASEFGLLVVLGLVDDAQFWRDPVRSLGPLEEASLHQIRRLELLTRQKTFAGWYITQEVDDTRWQRAEDARLLTRYLRKLARACRRMRKAPVSVSAFANGKTSPEEYAKFLRRLRREARIDQVLFQDSVGARKLTVEQATRYQMAMRNTAEPIVEIFDVINEEPFEARPAPIERIRRQLEAVQMAGFGAPLVFSLPEYQTPELLEAFGPADAKPHSA